MEIRLGGKRSEYRIKAGKEARKTEEKREIQREIERKRVRIRIGSVRIEDKVRMISLFLN